MILTGTMPVSHRDLVNARATHLVSGPLELAGRRDGGTRFPAGVSNDKLGLHPNHRVAHWCQEATYCNIL